MTTIETPNRIEGFWKGFLSGTNRGSIIIQVEQQGSTLLCKAIFEDQTFGPAILSLEGKLAGARAELRLVAFCGAVLTAPLNGQLIFNFTGDFAEAEGTWQTDIGTQGNCKVWRTNLAIPLWSLRVVWGKACIFFRRYCPTMYAIILLIVAIISLLKSFELSYPSLILLLVPAPYVFRSYFAELLTAYRVRKIGPVELEPQNPPTEDIRRVIAQQVQETVRFVVFDGYFALRTKLVLIWLSQQPGVNREQFNAYGTGIGVPVNNFDVTWNALVQSGCASLVDERLTITELGRRYVAYLTRQN